MLRRPWLTQGCSAKRKEGRKARIHNYTVWTKMQDILRFNITAGGIYRISTFQRANCNNRVI